ncbi:ATP-binding protein [Hyphomicrobium sp. D-2]|uniref:sensor histidine kinase n=1 Tax=Hyphomicrobium sp. D-2 TaxID=3041621 RepID=UPI002454C1AF|nr:ATP-binding protein [Hyphomicrobium sp. D-2]MDH4981323.1 ATP-binding protein [Hyphomicrobium sp. D-2]
MGLGVAIAADPEIHGNRQLVVQAVANLIENAIKYSGGPNGGRRTQIDIALNDLPDAVEICVADNGPGIAPEDRERVLKRFDAAGEEPYRAWRATGLGLEPGAGSARGCMADRCGLRTISRVCVLF